MLIQNNSTTRSYTVAWVVIAPGAQATVPDEYYDDIQGLTDLQLIGVPPVNTQSMTRRTTQALYNVDGSLYGMVNSDGKVTVTGRINPFTVATGQSYSFAVKEGDTIKVVGNSTLVGSLSLAGGTTYALSSGKKTFGPFVGVQTFNISATNGSANVTVGDAVLDVTRTAASEAAVSGNVYPLEKWRAAVGAARAGIRPAVLLMLGDSNTAGTGAGTGGTPTQNQINARIGSLAVQAAVKLSKTVLSSNVDSFLGEQNTTGSGVTLNQFDPRMTLGSGWAPNTNAGILGGRFLIGTGVTAGKMTFAAAGQYDRVRVLTASNPGLTTALSIEIDGSAVGTINENAAAAVVATTFNTTLGAHVLGFNNTASGNAFVIGAYAWNSAAPGIVMLQGGRYGGKASDFANVGSAWSVIATLPIVKPDLTIFNCTINDENAGTPVDSYKADMRSVCIAAKAQGDVILVGGFPSSSANTTGGLLDSYMQALSEIGTELGITVVDERKYLGYTWTDCNAFGYASDNNHPSLSGHFLIGGISADAAYTP